MIPRDIAGEGKKKKGDCLHTVLCLCFLLILLARLLSVSASDAGAAAHSNSKGLNQDR